MPRARTARRATARPLSLVAASIALCLTFTAASASPRLTVDISLLSFSDWHGQLDPISGVGGAAALSSIFRSERVASPNSLTLTAGDDFGASPALSNFFEEEPAVKAQNIMGVDAGALGNHNFDGGLDHLQQMIDLADYPYLSANLTGTEGALTGVAPWAIFSVGGVEVGVIGITNPDAASLVLPGRMGAISVSDPVPAANRARAQAQAAGAKITVAIAHMGITSFDATGAPSGPIVDFAEAVGGFDVILGDHTDVQWSGVINGQLVVENRSKGLTYARTMLQVDAISGRVARATNTFVVPSTSSVTPDPRIDAMLAPYRAALSDAYDARLGVATGVFPRGSNIERLREVAIGNLVADAMRARYGTQVALTNGGGLRAALPSSYAPADPSLRRPATGYAAGPPYDLVVGDVYTVLPFGNVVVTRTVTGAQLRAALTLGISALPGANGRFLQVSGLSFTYRMTTPPSVVDVTLDDGTPLSDETVYTLATNDFINAGGDGFTMLADGKGTTREVMAPVVEAHIRAAGTITPAISGRIVKVS